MNTIRSSEAMRRMVMGFACLSATVLLGGCHRRQTVPTLPPILLAPDFPPSPPATPGMVSPPPEEIATAPSVKVTEAKPKRPVRRPAPKSPATDTAAPVDTASAGPVPEESPIGELSAGGDSNAKTQQDAAGLIIESERRLSGFPQKAANQQQAQLRKVRNFLNQAKQALSSGDAEGARTLATKAKLLIDDLTK